MEVIEQDDPVTLAQYGQKKNLLHMSKWKWTNRFIKKKKKFGRLKRQMMSARRKSKGPKYQFGIRVPRSLSKAYELDKLNKDTLWAEAIHKEVETLMDKYDCFQVLPPGQDPPEDYQYIPLLWTFAVKFDGRRRARCVASGHVTEGLKDDIYNAG